MQLYKLEGASLMQRLVNIEAIKLHTRNVTVMTLGGAQRIFQLLSQRDVVGAAEILAEVKHLKETSTGPPPVRHQLGAVTINDEELLGHSSEAEADRESADSRGQGLGFRVTVYILPFLHIFQSSPNQSRPRIDPCDVPP